MCLVGLPFGREIARQIVREEATEGGLQVAGHHLVVMNVEPPKDALVELSAAEVVGLTVERLSTRQDVEAVVEMPRDHLLAQIEAAQLALRHSSLACDAGLLTLQLGGVDGVGVEGVEQLLAFLVELTQPITVGLPVLAGVRQDRRHMVEHELSNLGDVTGPQRDRCPVIGNEVFKLVGRNSSEAAAVLALATKTVEVVIEVAQAVARLPERQRFAAFAAVHRALEVVAVYTRLLAAEMARLAHTLDLIEQLLADERLVLPGVLDAFERHDADVVALVKDQVQV